MINEVRQAMMQYAEAGLSVLPTTWSKKDSTKAKDPALATWKVLQKDALTSHEIKSLASGESLRGGAVPVKPVDLVGVGIVTGWVSGGLELIDVDSKKDPNGTIWEELVMAIQLDDVLSGLWKEFYIERSPGGLHLLYRYEIEGEVLPWDEGFKVAPFEKKREGNLELAYISSGIALIETRGEGGYVVTSPTPGYETEQGSLTELPVLSKEERDRLIAICRSLCYVNVPGMAKDAQTPPLKEKHRTAEPSAGLTPFADYNSRATVDTVRELLEAQGWTAEKDKRSGDTILMLRPDNGSPSTAAHSGSIRVIERDGVSLPLFSVWTPNAPPFQPYKVDEQGRTTTEKKAYRPHEIYTLTQHPGKDGRGDYPEAMRTLYRQGYGDRRSSAEEVASKSITVSYVNNVNIVICKPGEELLLSDIRAANVQTFNIEAPADAKELTSAVLLIQSAPAFSYLSIAGGTPVRDYKYLADVLMAPYIDQEEDLTDPQLDQLRADIAAMSLRLRAADRGRFRDDIFTRYNLTDHGITKEDLKAEEAELLEKQKKAKDTAQLQKDVKKADELLAVGKMGEAVELLKKSSRSISEEALPLEDLLSTFTERDLIEAIKASPINIYSGYRFRDRDSRYNDLMIPSGALTVIAGRTGHRKTNLMMNIALNVAENKANSGGAYFLSFEEDTPQLILKLLNMYLNTDLREGLRSEGDTNISALKEYYRDDKRATEKIKGTAEKRREFFELTRDRLIVNRPPWRNVEQACRAIEYIAKEIKPSAVFIDYIQLLRCPDFANQTRQIELQEVCRQLRTTAVNTGLPIIIGAQFNRDVKMEADIDSDKLREAGDIEQEANLVIGLWDRKYTKEAQKVIKNGTETTSGGDKDRNGGAAKREPGILYAEILKARDGDTGVSAELVYNPITQRISDRRSVTAKDDEPKKQDDEDLPF